MKELYKNLLDRCTGIISDSDASVEKRLHRICEVLHTELEHYNWVGFYMANHHTKTLHLGPYVGAETDHVEIPFGKGICGQVALSNETFLVEDVSAQDNYIACSITVKSEIVVPLFVNGINIGQIDIDSHTLNAFTPEDQKFLERLNSQIASLFV
ncbi:GAF domain-containing protein [Myroides sp. LJL119]